jgi:predicted secreted protein
VSPLRDDQHDVRDERVGRGRLVSLDDANMMRAMIGLSFVGSLAGLLAVPALAQDQPVEIKFLDVGSQTVLKLPVASSEIWQLDAAHSFALDKVELKELCGVPALYQMRVKAKAAGFVVLAFERTKEGEPHRVVGTEEVGVKIDSTDPSVLTAGPGSTFAVNLKGTPGAGYTWKFDPKQSSGAELVDIEDQGWSNLTVPGIAERLAGGPAIYRFALKTKTPGRARLVFDYLRPWEDQPAQRQKVIELTTVK